MFNRPNGTLAKLLAHILIIDIGLLFKNVIRKLLIFFTDRFCLERIAFLVINFKD